MANTRAGNVLKVDTSAAFTGEYEVCGIKYIPGTSASIKAGSSSGNLIWEETGTAAKFEEVEFRESDGIYVTVAGSGAAVYLYLK